MPRTESVNHSAPHRFGWRHRLSALRSTCHRHVPSVPARWPSDAASIDFESAHQNPLPSSQTPRGHITGGDWPYNSATRKRSGVTFSRRRAAGPNVVEFPRRAASEASWYGRGKRARMAGASMTSRMGAASTSPWGSGWRRERPRPQVSGRGRSCRCTSEAMPRRCSTDCGRESHRSSGRFRTASATAAPMRGGRGDSGAERKR